MQRNIYLSLLHEEPVEGQEKAPKIPDSLLRAALLRRAVEDIHRIIQIRSAKQACSTLLQRGSVGDDLWQRFQRAEKEMEEELRDVVMEVSGEKNQNLCLPSNYTRQMVSQITGASQSSSLQMKLLRTPSFESD
jgi:translocation protein SEC66